MADLNAQPPQKQSHGYGKRPTWQWVVIYLVIAVVVYGLVYYFFMRDSGGGNGGGFNY
ncbi:MAG TPA: hypothetical protein VK674_02485 [Candidatus Limnocylindria bacterium]|nr:hypothetical protein [Candidatus Limnocylindria bacterium]